MTDGAPPRSSGPGRWGGGPFGPVTSALVTSAAFAIVAAVAGVAQVLPGGRWPVVHLFTLGVMTNLVVAFSQQFAQAVTGGQRRLPRGFLLWLNGAAGLVVVGPPIGWRWALATGATM